MFHVFLIVEHAVKQSQDVGDQLAQGICALDLVQESNVEPLSMSDSQTQSSISIVKTTL